MCPSESSLAILVIDENKIRASLIEVGLRESGHDNVTVVHDIAGVARTIAAINPDVIVIDLENPNRDVLENMFQLSRAVQRPVAMFVDRADRASIEAAVEAGVSASQDGDKPEPQDRRCIMMCIEVRIRCSATESRVFRRSRDTCQSVSKKPGIAPPNRGGSLSSDLKESASAEASSGRLKAM